MSFNRLTQEKREQEIPIGNEIVSREAVESILGTVSYSKAFFFYEGIGKPLGEAAVSLSDFCNKINTVASKCLAFHLNRGDFEKWVREVIGDFELAKRIGNIRAKRNIRKRLYECVSDRIRELKEMWPLALTMPESIPASQ